MGAEETDWSSSTANINTVVVENIILVVVKLRVRTVQPGTEAQPARVKRRGSKRVNQRMPSSTSSFYWGVVYCLENNRERAWELFIDVNKDNARPDFWHCARLRR